MVRYFIEISKAIHSYRIANSNYVYIAFKTTIGGLLLHIRYLHCCCYCGRRVILGFCEQIQPHCCQCLNLLMKTSLVCLHFRAAMTHHQSYRHNG